jgi:hypothetical protein
MQYLLKKSLLIENSSGAIEDSIEEHIGKLKMHNLIIGNKPHQQQFYLEL